MCLWVCACVCEKESTYSDFREHFTSSHAHPVAQTSSTPIQYTLNHCYNVILAKGFLQNPTYDNILTPGISRAAVCTSHNPKLCSPCAFELLSPKNTHCRRREIPTLPACTKPAQHLPFPRTPCHSLLRMQHSGQWLKRSQDSTTFPLPQAPREATPT